MGNLGSIKGGGSGMCRNGNAHEERSKMHTVVAGRRQLGLHEGQASNEDPWLSCNPER